MTVNCLWIKTCLGKPIMSNSRAAAWVPVLDTKCLNLLVNTSQTLGSNTVDRALGSGNPWWILFAHQACHLQRWKWQAWCAKKYHGLTLFNARSTVLLPKVCDVFKRFKHFFDWATVFVMYPPYCVLQSEARQIRSNRFGACRQESVPEPHTWIGCKKLCVDGGDQHPLRTKNRRITKRLRTFMGMQTNYAWKPSSNNNTMNGQRKKYYK